MKYLEKSLIHNISIIGNDFSYCIQQILDLQSVDSKLHDLFTKDFDKKNQTPKKEAVFVLSLHNFISDSLI